MNASRYRAGLLLALTFGAGAMVGVAGDRLGMVPSAASASETEAAEPRSEDPPREERREERRTAIEEFADDLGLTSDQRVEIEGLLDEYRAAVRDLNNSVRPQWRALMESVRTEIESVLTEDQVVQYRAILDERYRGGRDREDDETQDSSEEERHDDR